MRKETLHKLWKPALLAGMFFTTGFAEISSQQEPIPTDENCKTNLMPQEELEMLKIYVEQYGYERIPAENMGNLPGWMEYTRDNCSELPPPNFSGSNLAEFVNTAGQTEPVPLPPTPPPAEALPPTSPPPTVPAVESQPTAPEQDPRIVAPTKKPDEGLLKRAQEAVGVFVKCLPLAAAAGAGAFWLQQKRNRELARSQRTHQESYPHDGIEGGRPIVKPKTRREEIEEKGQRVIEEAKNRKMIGMTDMFHPKNNRPLFQINLKHALEMLFKSDPQAPQHDVAKRDIRDILPILRAFRRGPLDPYAQGLVVEFYEKRIGTELPLEKYDPEYPYHTKKKPSPETGLESDDY